MQLAEKFVSINGEGARAGELAVFIRFTGCNLKCSYCDTSWANEPGCPYTEMSPEEIYSYIRSTGITDVTLTGGEPLLQPDMQELLEVLLSDGGLRVEIETNGAVDLEPFCHGKRRPVFTMDWKLPGSGCEKYMLPGNFSLLEEEDSVKFVSSSVGDLERAADLTEKYDLTGRCHVFISPVFGSIEPAEIVEFMKARRMNDVRLQIQMHKVIWDPERRGV